MLENLSGIWCTISASWKGTAQTTQGYFEFAIHDLEVISAINLDSDQIQKSKQHKML